MSPASSHDELLAALDALEPLEPSDARFATAIDQMERVARRPHGLATLIDRYAGSSAALLLRPLTFLLSACASNREFDTPLAPLAWTLVRRLRSDDDWCRVNLLTAIQRMSMHDDLMPPAEPPPPELYPLLLDCLSRPPAVRATAIATVAYLHRDGLLDQFPREQLIALRRQLETLRLDTSDELSQMEFKSLDRFFEAFRDQQ